jgi:hypothetical protein
MTIEWLAGNRIRGTSTERTSTSGFSPISATQGGWKEVGRTTLGSAGDTIDISSLPDKRYYMILSDLTASGSTTTCITRLNNDSGSNYAYRRQLDGAADSTGTSQTGMIQHGLALVHLNWFEVSTLSNYATKEKLLIGHSMQRGSAGAGGTPERQEWADKWANTSDAVDQVTKVNTTGGASYASGSECVILGWDPSDSHTTNFWEELTDKSWTSGNAITTDTFTTKKYLWIQGWYTQSGTSGHNRFRVGNGTIDTGSNYSHNYAINGGTNGTAGSLDNLWSVVGQGSDAGIDRCFFSMFIINNASNEKLMIGHNVWSQTDGAGTVPERTEYACKWANTSNQINIVEININGSGSFSGGQIKVWGSN